MAPSARHDEGAPAPAGAGTTIAGSFGRVVRWEVALAIALVAVFVLGTASSPYFLTNYDIFTTCTNLGDVAIMALPMTLIIMTGEIDLSVASTLALGGETLGYLTLHHWPLALILLVVIAVGLVAGAINGLLVTVVGLPSLAVTIGTLTLYRGIANVILGANTVSDFPSFFNTLGVDPVPGVPFLSYSVLVFLVFAVIVGVVLHMTPLGRSLHAIGLNKEAARHAGFNVQRVKLALFIFSGVVCALVGMLYTFELNSAAEGIGIGFELRVITIVLLGGVSIFGGRGTIVGVVLAGFLFAGLQSFVLVATTLNENDFQVVTGALLVLSVLVPNGRVFAQRGRELLARQRARAALRQTN
ncbi:MAG: ABC transporter permease [Solirubrobacteraceae bacterium]